MVQRLSEYLKTLALLLAAVAVGWPDLHAGWISGDENIFIRQNPDVTGQGPPDTPFPLRAFRLWTHAHGDLYQPLPILIYAVQWAIHGPAGALLAIRCLDVLLHAACAILLWRVAVAILRRFLSTDTGTVDWAAWAVALLWACHPALAGVYAADMGRTHLLSGLFALVATGFYLRAVTTNGWKPACAALVALLLAMVSKPVIGWFLIAGALEWAANDWRSAVRSWRPYATFVICAAFAALTVITTQREQMFESVEGALFGDPLTRSLLALGMYARNLAAPLWLAPWYPPDPETGWRSAWVWLGAALLVAGAVVTVWAMKRQLRVLVIGLVWFWACLTPLLGFGGGRQAAAQDRYLYQPLMGGALILAAASIRLARGPSANRLRAIAIPAVLAVCFAPLAARRTAIDRSTLRRAERVVELFPTDPRALEMLAHAQLYHARSQVDLDAPIDPAHKTEYRRTLARVAAVAHEHPEFFNGPRDLAAFHRRLSYQLLIAGDLEPAQRHAAQAVELEPDSPAGWLALARANTKLERWTAAQNAFERQAQLLFPGLAAGRFDSSKASTSRPAGPAEPVVAAVTSHEQYIHLAEYGLLLLDPLQQPAMALPRLRAAVEWLRATQPTAPELTRLELALAECEILVGLGERGAAILQAILSRRPNHERALLLLGRYHLRSHHWNEALTLYGAIVEALPTHYEALRGYHEVCAQLARWGDAARAWQRAARLEPEHPAFAGFWAFSLACDGDPQAEEVARRLLERSENHPFACFAMAVIAARTGDIQAAESWVARGRSGTPAPEAREAARAAAAIRLLRASGRLPESAAAVEQALSRRP